jgi:hypothetical protein
MFSIGSLLIADQFSIHVLGSANSTIVGVGIGSAYWFSSNPFLACRSNLTFALSPHLGHKARPIESLLLHPNAAIVNDVDSIFDHSQPNPSRPAYFLLADHWHVAEQPSG